MAFKDTELDAYVKKRVNSALDEYDRDIVSRIKSGEVRPPTPSTQASLAGAVNYAPNSDIDYSTKAATVAGTTPADADDTNYEAYRYFQQEKETEVRLTTQPLRAEGHSLYAANEGTNQYIPDWDRVNGWIRAGSISGGPQHDIALHLLENILRAGQKWFVRARLRALDSALVPSDLQFYAGFWHKKSTGGEGWISGNGYTLDYRINGTPGARTLTYIVVASTDGGVQMMSAPLVVTDAPAVLSPLGDYIKLYYNPQSDGYIKFEIYREDSGSVSKIGEVRNSADLQFNDVGQAGVPQTAMPSLPNTAPIAMAITRPVKIGTYQSTWKDNGLGIRIPDGYNFSETSDQFLRFGFTTPTGVNRHIGIDRISLSTQNGEWSRDIFRYESGPTIAPTDGGGVGGGGGVFDPPVTGGGGGLCIAADMPVCTFGQNMRPRWLPYEMVQLGMHLEGGDLMPYEVFEKRKGTVGEFYLIKCRNGISVKVTVNHRMKRHREDRTGVQARNVKIGTKLLCLEDGKLSRTEVVYKRLLPYQLDIGTFSLRHTGGLARDGEGVYVAGYSKRNNSGLFHFNAKPDEFYF